MKKILIGSILASCLMLVGCGKPTLTPQQDYLLKKKNIEFYFAETERYIKLNDFDNAYLSYDKIGKKYFSFGAGGTMISINMVDSCAKANKSARYGDKIYRACNKKWGIRHNSTWTAYERRKANLVQRMYALPDRNKPVKLKY